MIRQLAIQNDPYSIDIIDYFSIHQKLDPAYFWKLYTFDIFCGFFQVYVLLIKFKYYCIVKLRRMSDLSTSKKVNEETHSQSKPNELDKSSKQGESDSNKTPFVYYVPHQPSKSVPVEKPNKQQQSLQKSGSRQRSRQKPQKYSKGSKNGDDQHSYKNEKNEKHERHDRQRDRDREKTKKSQKNHQQDGNNDTFVKQEAYRKTKLCPQLERGQCRKGSECNFAHSQAELRGLPDFRKTKLCIAFKEGKCGKLSSECKYAHGEAELKRIQKFSLQKDRKKSRSPPRKQKYHHHHSSKPQQAVYPPPPPPPPGYMGYINPYQSYMNPYVPGPSQPQGQYFIQRPPVGQYIPPNRVFNEYPPPPPPQPNSGQNLGNYGAFGSTGGFYPPPPSGYDYYSPYSMPPPPPSGYSYPGPKPPM